MFIKKSGFNKLVKEAYKRGNLYCGRDAAGIYVAGGYWAIQVFNGLMPKEIMGELFKLTGEIPDLGTAFRASRDGNQYEIPDVARFHVIETAEDAKTILEQTPLVLDGYDTPARIFHAFDSGDVFLANEKLAAMIDKGEIDRDGGESDPEGPLESEGAIYWHSEHMAFCIMERQNEARKDLIEFLRHMPSKGQ